MLRGLKHYWKMNLAVLLAAAVNTAVLTGALIVGDSVRGSLRDMTLDRLGEIDLALVAERFFPQSLAERLAAAQGFESEYEAAVPAVLLPGSAVNAETGSRASQVNVHGVDERFAGLFPAFSRTPFDLSRASGQLFPSVIINETLQRELGIAVGEPLLLNFRTRDDIPDDTLLGGKKAAEAVGTIRTLVTSIVPDANLGRFSLSPHQAFPPNVYVALADLQAALDQAGKVNAVFVAGDASSPAPVTTSGVAGGMSPAQTMLHSVLNLDDLGLLIEEQPDGLIIESTEFVLRPNVADAIEATALQHDASVTRVQSYLANAMTIGGRTTPYSTVAAIGTSGAPASLDRVPRLTLIDGSAVPPTWPAEQIVLNEILAADLDAEIGDTLRMEYYVVGPYEQLDTDSHDFVVGGIVAMRGLAAEHRLTPDYPGIEGTENIADWDPPFPVDLRTIRTEDEDYWDEYGATPKTFVAEDTARELWSTRYGSITSIRLTLPETTASAEFLAAFTGDLLQRLNVPQFGMRFLEVKAEGLQAAAGATDFSVLFISFSFFIIASAAMLVGLLFSLGIQARAGEVGLLLSVGYTIKQVRRQMIAEGGLIAALGAVVGLLAGVGYAALMMVGLRTLWVDAVGTTMLTLHVVPLSLVAGWVISVIVVLLSIWFTVRRLGRLSATALLKGSLFAASGAARRGGGRLRMVAVASATFAVAMLAYAVASGTTMDPMVFGTIGFPLLIAGLTAFGAWCGGTRGRLGHPGVTALLGMAARNSAWNPGRSILSVALIAFASFVIVTVAANHRDPTLETRSVESGTGGFALYATSDVPIRHDLNSPDARFDLGFPEQVTPFLEDARIFSLRTVPGDDASCLNLYRPQNPRILGVGDDLIRRGGFTFASTLGPDVKASDVFANATGAAYDPENPWTLLRQELEPGVIPAFGDANSVQWILHLGLGADFEMDNELGDTIRLRIVGIFAESVFRSELLISQENLLANFPSRSGYSTFLVEADSFPESIDMPADEIPDLVAEILEANLGDYGFDATRTDEKLAAFLVVQNTYLATFQLLGGLGLLLGTVGLGVVLLRNVIERRAELATLRAFGYRRASLSRMVLAENAFLLFLGTALGSLAALLAVAPRFVGGSFGLPWGSLGLILLAVLGVGMISSLAAVAGALRVPLLPVLKGDR